MEKRLSKSDRKDNKTFAGDSLADSLQLNYMCARFTPTLHLPFLPPPPAEILMGVGPFRGCGFINLFNLWD